MIEVLIASIPLALVASTPLVLAVQGELLVQRSGIINLGIEGMMLAAALCSVVAGMATGSTIGGFAGGIAGAAVIALIFGFFTITNAGDQIVTGTAINLLALGGTSFLFREMRETSFAAREVPRLMFDAVLPLAWIVIPLLLAVLLWHTTPGLRLRACGEHPGAVATAGSSVAAHRWLALAVESVLAGIAGAYLALAISNGFGENMTAGRGFIALSIVIFGRWRVKGALLGTLIFGTAAAMQYALQAASVGVPYHLLLALPYVVTLLILAGVAGRVRAPASLGRP